MKQVNIGVGHGLAVLVDDGARQMALGLVGTLHIDFALATLHDADGIEANDLHDGLRDRLVLDAGGHAEVLQFVIDEVDGVRLLQIVEFHQSLRQRYIIILSGDVLCAAQQRHDTGNDGEYQSSRKYNQSFHGHSAIIVLSFNTK